MRKLGVFLSGMAICMGLSLGFASLPAQAFNLFSPCASNPNAAACPTNANPTNANNSIYGANGILLKVANIMALIVGITAVIIIIISGINYMMSQGDSSKVQSAKNTIIYAAVGLVVAITARSIIAFIVTHI